MIYHVWMMKLVWEVMLEEQCENGGLEDEEVWPGKAYGGGVLGRGKSNYKGPSVGVWLHFLIYTC